MLGLAASRAASVLFGVAANAAEPTEGEDPDPANSADRTGPTQIVGIRLCPAVQDYVNLINSKGGVEGYKIKADEIDHEYKVPQADVEAYERDKQDGAVSYMIYGTPHAQALNQKLDRRQRSPVPRRDFGLAASADELQALSLSVPGCGDLLVAGRRGRQVRQGPARRRPARQEDRPCLLRQPGRPPRRSLLILEDLQKTEGYELRTFAVPPPGVEMGAQVLDITQRYHPDFIIDHLFGRSPSVAIKEYKRAGFPLSKVMGLVWASAEADIDAAGGWAVAEGYHTMSFAGVGDDFPVRQEIKAMYKAQGKEPPKEMDDTVMYNRGLLIQAALHVEAGSITRSRPMAATFRPGKT